MGRLRERGWESVPFVFEAVLQLKDLDFYPSQSVMVQNVLIWLPLAVSLQLVVFGVRGEIVAGFELREVALDVA